MKMEMTNKNAGERAGVGSNFGDGVGKRALGTVEDQRSTLSLNLGVDAKSKPYG
jgi:hypothetical protein